MQPDCEKSFGIGYKRQLAKGAASLTFATEYEPCNIDFVAKCTDIIWQLFQCMSWNPSSSKQVSILAVLERVLKKETGTLRL